MRKIEQTTVTLGELIENNVDIFDFDYPFYSGTYKTKFEEHFIDFFYYDEIGHETVARFKHRLKIKFNLIMPYWNKIFVADTLEQRILDNYDITETYVSDVSNDTIATNVNDVNTSNDSTNKNLNSDTPTTKTDFEQIDFFSSIVKDIGNSSSETNANSTNNVDDDRHEEWTRTMKGNMGIQTDSMAIEAYWRSLRQIENEIFKQCDDLFMGVY